MWHCIYNESFSAFKKKNSYVSYRKLNATSGNHIKWGKPLQKDKCHGLSHLWFLGLKYLYKNRVSYDMVVEVNLENKGS